MAVEFTSLGNVQVVRDTSSTWRIYDAWGPGLVKYLFDGGHMAVDDTTGDPLEWELTITEAGGGGDTTMVITDRAGGALLITTDNADGDGINMQLGGASGGESVKLDGSSDYLYFGIKFAINDVDQTDIFFGVGVTDTDWSGGITDGVYFRSEDESAALYAILEKDSTESAQSVDVLADNTFVTAEAYWSGEDGNIKFYIDGSEVERAADSNPNFPDDEEMRLTLEFLTGETTANTCTIEWMRMIHIRA